MTKSFVRVPMVHGFLWGIWKRAVVLMGVRGKKQERNQGVENFVFPPSKHKSFSRDLLFNFPLNCKFEHKAGSGHYSPL